MQKRLAKPASNSLIGNHDCVYMALLIIFTPHCSHNIMHTSDIKFWCFYYNCMHNVGYMILLQWASQIILNHGEWKLNRIQNHYSLTKLSCTCSIWMPFTTWVPVKLLPRMHYHCNQKKVKLLWLRSFFFLTIQYTNFIMPHTKFEQNRLNYLWVISC